jgi:hypothetical protein
MFTFFESHCISHTEAVTIAWGRDAVRCSYLYITNEIKENEMGYTNGYKQNNKD